MIDRKSQLIVGRKTKLIQIKFRSLKSVDLRIETTLKSVVKCFRNISESLIGLTVVPDFISQRIKRRMKN